MRWLAVLILALAPVVTQAASPDVQALRGKSAGGGWRVPRCAAENAKYDNCVKLGGNCAADATALDQCLATQPVCKVEEKAIGDCIANTGPNELRGNCRPQQQALKQCAGVGW